MLCKYGIKIACDHGITGHTGDYLLIKVDYLCGVSHLAYYIYRQDELRSVEMLSVLHISACL